MALQSDPQSLLFCGIAAAAASIPFLIGMYRSSKESGFMKTLAGSLGFTYEQRGDAAQVQAKKLIGGQIYDLVYGVHNGVTSCAFTYRRLVGGRNRYWSYMTVLQTPLSIRLPDMVLKPNQMGIDAAAEMAVERDSLFDNYEKVQLEGDFNKYFSLYVTKGSQVEVRELFTPDIMADLVDRYQPYGIEFSNAVLYLYPMKLITDENEFMQALALLEDLAKHLSPALQAMATSAPVDQKVAVAK